MLHLSLSRACIKVVIRIVELLSKCYNTGDDIEKLNAELRNVRPGLMTPAEYAQELSTRILSCGSVYDKR